ncbi:MAG: apurinic endonuclease Apn1 [Acidimicrobiaceae bacterium]|jgi:deoxyribonuclease-4|nr:apurinic endonuclease Apn1 [Acidimicrobiaceae bacterium]
MDIGAHVSSSGGLLKALDRGVSIGADVVQIFTQSPRMWRSPSHSAESLAAYRAAQAAHPSVHATYCHATYLINLAAADDELFARSRRSLVENLVAATAIGASGVVLHVGSHRGAGLEAVLAQVKGALISALDEAGRVLGDTPCPLLLENAAGTGGTVGRSFAELAAIIDATGADPRLGVCLDTQHLFASGVDFSTIEAADAAVAALDAAVGLDRLRCIHLNDSKVALGANRDRHENLGDGEIGVSALACLIGHPDLQHAPAMLEVPGDGDGPRAEDVTAARAILADGLSRRAG